MVAIVAGVFVLPVATGWISRYWTTVTEPILILPRVDGIATLNGEPLEGIEVRRGRAINGDTAPCNRLPVVGTSDAAGKFHVPAVYRPLFLVKARGYSYDTCFMRGEETLLSYLELAEFNEFGSIRVRCDLPGIKTGHPEDHPCVLTGADYSLQRTVRSVLAESRDDG